VSGGVAQIFRESSFLTGFARGDAEAVVRSYILQHQNLFGLSASELAAFETIRSDREAGGDVTHLYLSQRIAGRKVFGSLIKGHVDAFGRLISIEGSYYPNAAPARMPSALLAEQAVVAALRSSMPETLAKSLPNQRPVAAGSSSSLRLASAVRSFPNAPGGPHGDEQLTIFAPGSFSTPISVRQVVFPTATGSLLAWQVDASDRAHAEAYRIVVDATSGKLLYRTSLVRQAFNSTASVFQKNPVNTPLAVVPFRGSAALSPLGWSSNLATMGNNVQGDSATPLSGINFVYPFTNAWKNNGLNNFDLAGLRLRFTPTDTAANTYTVTTAAADSTAPAATDLLPFFSNTDDGTINLVCGGGWSQNVLGATFTSFNVNTNGSIGFGAGSTDDFPSKVAFSNFARRVAGLWRDLDPGAGGSLTGDCAPEGGGTRVRVVWNSVPDSGGTDLHTLAIVLHGIGTGPR
jgi:hypothetical protein